MTPVETIAEVCPPEGAVEAPCTAAGPSQAPRGAKPRGWRRLARAVERRVTRLKSWVLAPVTRRAGSSNFAAAVYYLFYGSFGREQQAVMAGKRMFQEIAAAPENTCSLLRRNTHRLEKGLLMRPRRPVFAVDYIEETVACYEQVHRSPEAAARFEPGELKWSRDVLTTYFEVTGAHPVIDRLRERFRALPAAPHEGPSMTPYRRELSRPLPVHYEDLLELSRRRRSVRWFLQKPVPRELIEQAVVVAAQSPSACNRQPFIFRVFDDPQLAKKVGAIPGGTAGFSQNFPAVIVVVGQQRHYYDERDRHIIYIDSALASMSLVYALETLGLSTCCINWPDLNEPEREMATLLKLEPDERPIMLIAVGYPDPDGLVAYSQKKPVERLCRFNFE